MSASANKRLFDISTRKQFFVERVARWETLAFMPFLMRLDREVRYSLSEVDYRTLDAMSRRELARLVSDLKAQQSAIWDEYTQTWIARMESFMAADLYVSDSVYTAARAEIDGEEPETYKEDERRTLALWSDISSTPIPANGFLLPGFMAAFAAQSMQSTENIIRQGWSNGWTVAQTREALTGSGENVQGKSSLHDRMLSTDETVTDTVMQFIEASVAVAVCGELFSRYAWNSIIDGRTSDICLWRAGHIYRYGEGPIPPAHIRCRSYTSPVYGDEPYNVGLYEWMIDQPESVQFDILGGSKATKLRKRELSASDLKGYRVTEPMSIEQYRESTGSILLT